MHIKLKYKDVFCNFPLYIIFVIMCNFIRREETNSAKKRIRQ